MKLISLLFPLLFLFFTSCASNSLVSQGDSGEVSENDWLVELSILRVRDETILKVHDRLPLDITDLEELVRKEATSSQISNLIDDLGINPALTKSDLSHLKQMGLGADALAKLGDTSPTPLTKESVKVVSTPEPKVPQTKKLSSKSDRTSPETYPIKTTSKNSPPPSEEKKKKTASIKINPSFPVQNRKSFDPMSPR